MPPLAPGQTIESARADWQTWRAGRLASVVTPTGNLALVETRWLAAGEEQSLTDALDGQPETVTATELTRTDIVTGRPEHAVRLWDAASDGIRNFVTIDAYDYDPGWVIEATFTPVPGDRKIPFEHLRDNGATRDLAVPGDISFTREGVHYELHAFDDDGTLLLVFGDPTNGHETYGSGRFLFVHGEPGTDRVILDFNRAFVPPCGFSAQYNCPLPPRQNRFAEPVIAGEKLPVFRDGYYPQ